MMLFLTIAQSLKYKLSIADLKNAFCQSKKLDRSNGPIYVEATEGLPLEKGSLIELLSPVYGLNDAPVRWHRTLTDYLKA